LFPWCKIEEPKSFLQKHAKETKRRNLSCEDLDSLEPSLPLFPWCKIEEPKSLFTEARRGNKDEKLILRMDSKRFKLNCSQVGARGGFSLYSFGGEGKGRGGYTFSETALWWNTSLPRRVLIGDSRELVLPK
jgi:hypothetical protein